MNAGGRVQLSPFFCLVLPVLSSLLFSAVSGIFVVSFSDVACYPSGKPEPSQTQRNYKIQENTSRGFLETQSTLFSEDNSTHCAFLNVGCRMELFSAHSVFYFSVG